MNDDELDRYVTRALSGIFHDPNWTLCDSRSCGKHIGLKELEQLRWAIKNEMKNVLRAGRESHS